MKIASLRLLFTSLAFVSGARQGRLGNKKGRKTLKANGDTCSANKQCSSNCCTRESTNDRTNRSYVCKPRMPGTSCVSRFTGGSSEEWLSAVNTVREKQLSAIGGTSTDLEWSSELMSKAQSWANTIAADCKNGVPVAESNPEDYGVVTILNVANPEMAVNNWVRNGLNAAKIPSSASNPFTQLIWSGTEFVGCADATSSLSGTACSAAVCYFAFAGNCAWSKSKYSSWQDAVLSGDVCSTTCPSDKICPEDL